MRVRRAALLDVLRHGEFRALWGAEAISVLGDQLARVALALLVFDRTSSALLTALTYALTFTPAILGGWLLSGLADRYPRRRVLVTTDLVRAGLAAAMAIPALSLPVLWVLVCLLTLVSAPFKAAQLALLPQVLPTERYQAGLAVRQMTAQLAQVVGFAGGGVLVMAVTVHGALLFNAVTFLASATLVAAGVRARPAPHCDAEPDTPDVAASGASWRRLVPPFALASLIGLYVVPEGLAAPYAGALGTAAASVGLLLAADPIGSVLGAWWASRSATGEPPTWRSVTVPAAAAGLPLVVCVLAPSLVGSVVLWAISGVLSTLYLIRLQAVVVAIVPDARRGTVLGRLTTCLYASQGVAIVLGGVLAEQWGPIVAVAAAGGLGTALAAAIATVRREARPRPVALAEDEPTSGGRTDGRHRSLLRMTTSSGGAPSGPPDLNTGDEVGEPSSRTGNGSGTSMTGAPAVERSSRAGRRGWALWTQPRRFVLYQLGVTAAAAAVSILVATSATIQSADLATLTIIVALGLLAAELSRQIERRRRRFSDTPHVNFSSVWTLAAALLLPPVLISAVAIVLYAHLWVRSWRGVMGIRAYRVVFSTANVILSCQVAAWSARQLGLIPLGQDATAATALTLVLVVVLYFVVNSGIVATAIALLNPGRSVTGLVGSFSENVLELATLCLGAVTALLLSWQPWLVTLMVVPLYALHRSVLIRQLERAATRDSKTGLLNASSWHALARTELERASRHGTTVGVLMIDIDNFRRVNNEHGHLAGDEALRAVGEVLQREVRDDDLCGRFGGEEFVIVLPGVAGTDLVTIADRVRTRVADTEITVTQGALPGSADRLKVSVSIGAASFPAAGTSLEEILLAADTGLFAAKDSGRNRVVMTT
ncbi:MFS transporter [Amycolatopsis aidingensis]|uniref:MFS transporter n=1 Tax=Amycolatopsis aidingensis TaxID=2842453 RepID=UPI001C0BCE41|nr:MFS transporter [Amycolatopsis aidingensis]